MRTLQHSSGGFEQVGPQQFANGWDGLIRSIQTGNPQVEKLARRTLTHWRALISPAVEFSPLTALINGKEVLAATDEGGRWILPVFMAGLRRIEICDETTEVDLLRFSTELAFFDATLDSIAQFRDWLWSGGAEGFEVNVQLSLVEKMDAADESKTVSPNDAAAVRAYVVRATGLDAQIVASRDVDLAALRDEFQVSLDMFCRESAGGRLGLAPDQCEALRNLCESGSAWLNLELRATLANEELRVLVPPVRLASWVLSSLRRGVEPQMLVLLGQVQNERDEYCQQVTRRLNDEGVTEIIAGPIDFSTPAMPEALAHFIQLSEAKVGRSLCHALLGTTGDSELLLGLAHVVQRMGLDRFVDKLEMTALDAEQAQGLTRVSVMLKTPTALLEQILARAPADMAAQMISALPSDVALDLAALVKTALRDAQPKHVESLVTSLASSSNQNWVRLFVDLLSVTGGKNWTAHSLYTACCAINECGLARQCLLPWIRDRQNSADLRLMAARALPPDPDLRREACKWRPGELLDPPKVRQQLATMRDELR